MAETKREKWEVERDREEIAQLLVRHRSITHQRVADILNQRRKDEYQKALASLAELEADEAIPAVREPYALTRQMIDYDVRAILKELRERSLDAMETVRARQLARYEDLYETARNDYERSKGEVSEIQEDKETVGLQTTVGQLAEEIDGPLSELLSTRERSRRVEISGATKVKLRRKKAQLVGDPRFLQAAAKPLERIDALYNLGSINVNVNSRNALAALLGISPDDLPDPPADGSSK
jgi:hypothetical protein